MTTPFLVVTKVTVNLKPQDDTKVEYKKEILKINSSVEIRKKKEKRNKKNFEF